MPINSDVPAIYPEKLAKSTAPVPGAASSVTPSSSLPSKSSVPTEQPVALSCSKLVENSLIKHQGQKWQQYFDFEKMLKQIRVAEKQHLRHKSDSATGSSSNGKSSSPANTSSAVSPPKAMNTASFKCTRPLKQVQRLNGTDMHYYGIVPKQTAMDVIVCSVCRGIYTKVGFNNHMMLQHPTVWSTVSTKISSSSSVSEAYSLLTNDNSQDCIRDTMPPAAADTVGSPSDLSGIMSTSSNASSSSSSMSSSAYVATPRHKGSKGGSTAGSSSSSSGARSRSKQTKHSSSTATTAIHSSSTSSDAGHTTSKSSKKSSTANTTNSTAAIATAIAPLTLNTNCADSVQAITIFSSSSNSSCSLPPTPKMIGANAIDPVGPPVPQESTFSSASLLPHSATKDKTTTVDSAASFVLSSKKKVKSPTFTAHESVDSSASNSSSEYDHASSSGTGTSSKSSLAPFVSGAKESVVGSLVPMKAAGSRDTNCFDAQISELDQAVSSITSGQADNKNVACMEGIAAASSSVCPAAPTFQMPSSTAAEPDKLPTAVTPIAAVPPLIAQNYAVPEMSQASDEPIPHSTSDDNSILTLEDVLDSKFINEILNTAESEIHFDESALDSAAQQTFQQQQPVAKRMRYDESLMEQSHQQSVSSEMSGDFTAYQQQQTQQQYAHYDASTNLEDIKVYGGQQQSSMAVQYQAQFGKVLQQQDQQHQITTIDAMQLQQLLYQQQNMNVYGGGIDPSTASALQQQQQFDQSGVVNAKHIIDLCSTEDLQKPKGMGLGTGEFSAMEPSIHNTYEDGAYDAVAAHFQVFNVPSLTDDISDEVDMLVPHIVGSVPRTESQYVLPSNEEHLIYEITDNNQVAVMSQQRQQQVIAEFLTQATYESMEHINASNSIHGDNLAAITHPAASALTAPGNCKETWDEVSDLLNFDFSCIETVKSLTGSSSGGVTAVATTESKSVKMEHSKYYDDLYFNVFIYAGIPRPLSINCFGLVKLPLAAATTFRQHLLSTRKANNSLISLGGGINGIVGNNTATAVTRLANVNSKTMPNYFSSLPCGSSNSSTAMGNEFSIGSITITNSPMTQQQAYTHPKQSGTASSNNGSVEITFNATANGSAMSPVSALHRSRSKMNSVNASSAGSTARNKPQGGGSTPIAVVTPTSRLNSRPNTSLLSQNAKTIYVCSTPSNINDRVKFIKRGALLSCKAEVSRKHRFSSRQIADILGSVGKGASLRYQSPLQQSATSESSHEALADEQIRLNRVNRFYERRRKLFDLACSNARQHSDRQQQPLQLKQKLLKQQLCSRMFSDYGVGGMSHCKSSNSGSTGAGDAVRVFV